MKRFLRKRWHRIPIGIVAVLMALILVAGSAFAAYTAWTGTAEVEVGEAITVVPGAGILNCSWTGTTLIVNEIVAGEGAATYIDISNSSSVSLDVTVAITQTGGLGETVWVPGTLEDFLNAYESGPAPIHSWVLLAKSPGLDGPMGNPITFTVPPESTEGVGITLQAGTNVIPFTYIFDLTVER